MEKKLKQLRINTMFHPEIIYYLELPQTHTFCCQVICIVAKDKNHKKSMQLSADSTIYGHENFASH